MKIEPLNRWILCIECEDPRDQSKSVIQLPKDQDALNVGKVVALDDTPYNVPAGALPPPRLVEVGDIIYYGTKGLPVIVDNNERRFFVAQSQILGRVRGVEVKDVPHAIEGIKDVSKPSPQLLVPGRPILDG